MSFFKANKTLDRINRMLENAKEGKQIEAGFDETKLSALETKFAHYLKANGTSKIQLNEEKAKIHALISDISHQTKTPMANIMLYGQLLSESNLTEENEVLVSALTSQVEKLNFLINSLIKTSRLETGIISLTKREDNLLPLVQEVLEEIKLKAQAKHIKIILHKSQGQAIFDYKWTAEAIYNILDNAVKYTPSHGEINISITTYQFFCRLDISDSGIGIKEDEIPKIFQRFYRSQTVVDQEGVGIGLFLAKEIVTRQGGYIKVASELGKGSKFSIFIPMKD